MLETPTIKNILPYTALAGIIFFIMMFFGCIVAMNDIPSAEATLTDFKENQATPINSLSQPAQAAAIIISNSVVGISIMLAGMILLEWFGIFFGSIFGLSFNGFMIGKIIFVVARTAGWKAVLIGVIFHAPIELFAVFLSAGVGFYVGYNGMLEYCKGEYPILNIYPRLLIFYAKTIFPLFIIAGFLEVYVTTAMIAKFV